MDKDTEVTTICISKALHALMVKAVARVRKTQRANGALESKAGKVYEDIILAGLRARGEHK